MVDREVAYIIRNVTGWGGSWHGVFINRYGGLFAMVSRVGSR